MGGKGLDGAPFSFGDLPGKMDGQLPGRVASGARGGLALNPDRKETWTLESDDEMVVLRSDADPDGWE
jgi:hypothetical protein